MCATTTSHCVGNAVGSCTGTFSGVFRINPGNVTVTSSRGATASSAVTVVY